LPDLPARVGDPTADYLAAMKYLDDARELVLDAIRDDVAPPDRPATGGCFALALLARTLPFVHGAAPPEVLGRFVQRLADAGEASHVPKDRWQTVIEKAKAGAPAEEVRAAVAKVFEDVPVYLDAKRAAAGIR
jgi:hypothetical protein